MKRRTFVGSISLPFISYNLITSNTDNKYSLENNSLVHTDKYEPAKVIETKFNNIQVDLPNLPTGKLLLIQNKYGDVTSIYNSKEYTVNGSKDTKSINLQFASESVHNTFAYTIYYRQNSTDEWSYLGESEPLKISNNKIVIDKDVENLKTKKILHITRHNRNGYYEMYYKNITRNDFVYNVSKQYYHSYKRVLGYGRAHEIFIDNNFVKYLGNVITNSIEHEGKTDMYKLRKMTKFVQGFIWMEDIDSLNKYEYIRTPHHSVTVGIADCKDTTMLLNGLITNALDIETALIFSPGHVQTGMRFDTLNETDKKYLENKTNLDKFNVNDKVYIPIETTNKNELGKTNLEVNCIYEDNQYKIIDKAGLVEHASEGFLKMAKGE